MDEATLTLEFFLQKTTIAPISISVKISTMKKKLNSRTRLLPESFTNFIKLRLEELYGLSIFGLGIYILLSFVTYDPSDPSFNMSHGGQIHNWGGLLGAKIADFLRSSVGLAAFPIGAVIAVWGFKRLQHLRVSMIMIRSISIPFLMIIGSLGFAGFIQQASLHNAGGIIGRKLWNEIFIHINILKSIYGVPFWALSGTCIALWILGFMWIINLEKRQWGWVGKVCLQAFLICLKPLKALRTGRSFSFPKLSFVGADLYSDEKVPETRKKISSVSDLTLASATTTSSVPISQDLDIGRLEGLQPEDDFYDDETLNLIPQEDTTYQLPPLSLLTTPTNDHKTQISQAEYEERAQRLMGVLEDFGVRGNMVKVRPGPVVTLYELLPAPGIKSSRVIGLADDIARSMSAIAARVAVIPGRNAIGIELPNEDRQTVFLRELLNCSTFDDSQGALTLALGKDISGASVVTDLSRMPHLLVAGTTGSGKSVGINSMILSLVYRLPPSRCKLIMIDPKMLELSVYDGIPHLLTPVVTDPKKAVVALKWAVREMENRYRSMSKLGVRNIIGYNQRISEAKAKGEIIAREVQTGFDTETGKPVFEKQPLELEPLPYIVVVVDEMADLMLVAGKDIEAAVQRLAQMARAAGIHLIMATQRPSVDVITGTIKANFPTRISFQVTSKIDSRTILGEQGGEQLLGQGDMLYMAPGGRLTRVHGPFVSDQEVEKIVQFLKNQSSPDYVDDITNDDDEAFGDMLGFENSSNSEDALYNQAVALVMREGKASTSFVQRHLKIGYNRAARLIDQMEANEIISAANHVGRREVLRRHAG